MRYITTDQVGEYIETPEDDYLLTQELKALCDTSASSEVQAKKDLELIEKHSIILMMCEGTSCKLAESLNTTDISKCQ